MKFFIKTTSVFALLLGVSSYASAATTYYVYQKADTSTCDISTKAADDYNRGSQYHLIGSDSSRSDVKKIGKEEGCQSF